MRLIVLKLSIKVSIPVECLNCRWSVSSMFPAKFTRFSAPLGGNGGTSGKIAKLQSTSEMTSYFVRVQVQCSGQAETVRFFTEVWEPNEVATLFVALIW